MNITKEQADKVIKAGLAAKEIIDDLPIFHNAGYAAQLNEEALTIMRGLEDAAPVCNHEWFQTGAMLSNEKRCIKCGEWGKLYTSPQAAQTEAALCEMVRLSEDAGLYDSDFQAGRAGSKP